MKIVKAWMDLKEKRKTLRSHLCIYALVSMYGGGIVLVDNSERERVTERERERERMRMRGYVSVYTTVTSKSLLVVNSEYCENSFFHDN